MRPKLSIVVPIHDMKNGDFFLSRLVNSLFVQTFKDFEIVITKRGKMAENTNEAIKRAQGEFVKVLYMDDYLAHENVLKDLIEACKGYWIIAGADNNPTPYWTDDIQTGNNKLGSPSALMFKNHNPLFFDEKMSWLLDCDLYKRLCERYGKPDILPGNHIGIGIHDGQMSNILTEQEKLSEFEYMNKKHV